jgi:NTE family protein
MITRRSPRCSCRWPVRNAERAVRPLTIVTADVLTSHVRWFGSGPLVLPLLAATAIPGVFPPVMVDGRLYGDAGSVANVPMQAAIGRGAASLVVLDTGDVCHLDRPPRGIPDALLGAAMTAMRQRVLVEAPLVAQRVPVLYLPRPCARNRSLLDLDTADLSSVLPARWCPPSSHERTCRAWGSFGSAPPPRRGPSFPQRR